MGILHIQKNCIVAVQMRLKALVSRYGKFRKQCPGITLSKSLSSQQLFSTILFCLTVAQQTKTPPDSSSRESKSPFNNQYIYTIPF
jgi:hypothetical protein